MVTLPRNELPSKAVTVPRLAVLSLIVLAAVLPLFTTSYVHSVLFDIYLFGFLGLCWNLIGGYGGQLSIGHALFFGIGAYTPTLLYVNWGISPWIGIFVGCFLCCLAAMLMGFLSFRFGLRGHYFALGSIAFAEIARFWALSSGFMGGASGILIPLKRGPSVGSFQFSEKWPFYYIALLFLIGAAVVTHLFRSSKLGLHASALGDSEKAAQSIGINVMRVKMEVLILSAGLTGLGGCLYAQYIMYIDPNMVFGINVSVEMIVRASVGGIKTIAGPIIGSLILGCAAEVFRSSFGNLGGAHLMVYGLILVLVIFYLPNGIVGLLDRKGLERGFLRMKVLSRLPLGIRRVD